MSFVDDVKRIQVICRVPADGIFGPVTAAAVLRELVEGGAAEEGVTGSPKIDARTQKTLDSLDPKAVHRFTEFILRAKATAATFGCDYVAICGNRTWDEQAALRRKYLAGGPKAAPAGYSWHNFGTAMDFGVFRGAQYLDDTDEATAERVHAACAAHAKHCGLEWGGLWKGRDCDPPHFQIEMEHSAPSEADREKFKREGSVL